jgi:hypothetical protein
MAVGLLGALSVPATITASASSATTPAPARLKLGYWLVNPSGRVVAVGEAHYYGSVAHMPKGSHAVSIAGMPDGDGYWVATNKGQVFSFGAAKLYGELAGAHTAARPSGSSTRVHGALSRHHLAIKAGSGVIEIATAPNGHGYWLTDSLGQVYTFGDAHFFGPKRPLKLGPSIGSMVTDPAGGGYWLLAKTGKVLGFGGAHLYGATAKHNIAGATAMAPTPMARVTGSPRRPVECWPSATPTTTALSLSKLLGLWSG